MADNEPSFLGLFSRESNPVTLKSGQVLFKKGDPAHSMYVVLSGEVRIGDDNVTFEQVSAGSIVGEMALIDSAPRNATAVAITDATLIAVSQKQFVLSTSQSRLQYHARHVAAVTQTCTRN